MYREDIMALVAPGIQLIFADDPDRLAAEMKIAWLTASLSPSRYPLVNLAERFIGRSRL
jgi:hypothetical protein